MKKFVIFLSALTLFPQAHARISSHDLELVRKDLTNVADELATDLFDQYIKPNFIIGGAIYITATALTFSIILNESDPITKFAQWLAVFGATCLTADIANNYFLKNYNKKLLQAQKILDSVNERLDSLNERLDSVNKIK